MKKTFISTIAVISIVLTSSCSSNVPSINSSDASFSKETITSSNNGEDIIITIPKWSIPGYDESVFEKINNINSVFNEVVDEFNSADNGYKIVFKDYSEYYDSDQENSYSYIKSCANIDFQISMDLMNGEPLDIIPQGVFIDNGKFYSFAEKGAFIDFYSFMENDPNVNLNTVNAHILELSEINNKLYYMPLAYGIKTLAGYTKYVGSKENWSMDELKKAWQNMPENSTFNGQTTKDYVYITLLRGELSSFIDYTKGKCYFDSPEFIDILDYCNSFPEPIGYEFKTECDWNAPTFLFPFNVNKFDDFHINLWNEQNDEISLVGYPTENESGSMINTLNSYAINAKSSPEVQEGAWQFIKMLVSYDKQHTIGKCFFPINNEAFQAKANEEMNKKENKVSFQSNDEIDIGTLTKDEYDRLTKFINNTKKIDTGVDEEAFAIIEEELFNMFANAKTSKETAKSIQNRVGLYVNEKY